MRTRSASPHARRLLKWSFPLLLLGGCSGHIEAPPSTDRPSGAAPPAAAPPAGGAPAGPAANGAPGVGASGCEARGVRPGRAPLRRLTRFEYNNTVRDLLGDTTQPGNALPSEEIGNGFGNDADALSVSSLLAEQYATVAEGIARRATETPALLGKLAPCAATVTAATEEACARAIVAGLAPRAFRRPLEAGEADGLVALWKAVRAKSGFGSGVAAVIEAVLQAPDFLYRIEWGVPDRDRPELRRPSGPEMATRLSYLFWGTMPDEPLQKAAQTGELLTPQGVLAQATRLLDDPRARPVIRFFFDNLLPLGGLADLERDRTLFPKFSPAVGRLLREETQRLLEHEIFEGPGTWSGALTAPYTFLNGPLATFYGMTGVQGESFRKVPLDTTRRLGVLTSAGVMAGTTHSNETSPVVRGSFVVQRLMCRKIPLPTGELLDKIKPPEPYTGKTARERYAAHSADPACAGCHKSMDPVGLALENYDPVGLFRDKENGVTIDASGAVPGVEGIASGPVDLVKKVAASEDTQGCFAVHWLNFGYGRTLGDEDACTQASVGAAFESAGGDVRKLLLALTQTDSFLYLPRP